MATLLDEVSNSSNNISFDINMDFLNSANSPIKHRHEPIDFSTLTSNINFINSTFMDLIAKNSELSLQVNKLAEKVFVLEKDLAYSQQYGRRENIEITGIPESVSNDNLLNYILLLFEKIGMCNIARESFHAWHRLKKTDRHKPANVIVRFVNRQDAHDALERRKLLKGLPGLRNIYIIENLCPKYMDIFDKCNELKRTNRISRTWTYNGIVHYKTSNERNGRGKKLFHMDEVTTTFPPPPPPPALMDLVISLPAQFSTVPDDLVVDEPPATVLEAEDAEMISSTVAETSSTLPVVEIGTTDTSALAVLPESVTVVQNSAPAPSVLETRTVDEADDSQFDVISPAELVSCYSQQDVELRSRACSDGSNLPNEDEEVPLAHTSQETTFNPTSPLNVSHANERMDERFADVGDISIKLGMYAPLSEDDSVESKHPAESKQVEILFGSNTDSATSPLELDVSTQVGTVLRSDNDDPSILSSVSEPVASSSSSVPNADTKLADAPQADASSPVRYRFDNLLQICLEGVKMRPKVLPCDATSSSKSVGVNELIDQDDLKIDHPPVTLRDVVRTQGSSLLAKKAVLNSFSAPHRSSDEPGTSNKESELDDLSPNDLDLDSSIALNSTLEAMSATVAAEKIMDVWSSGND